ncbi:feruloyl-CoA synthase [Fibrella sp. HMF5335]|uniref:Feruloyl-CoA synthase n=1 Tax=Fibrella rubiginis TaxID=2817060 RepID=A0A939GFM1_9BACT|nr:feruloyl-CoA synthase [Fibrella rubiginis]MBO0938262.1 feruloyl-CoA synthase [Fibrella rubiginis]
MTQTATFGPIATRKLTRSDGSILIHSEQALQPFPQTITQKLMHWAGHTPDQPFLARRNAAGWGQPLTYANTLRRVEAIAQYLLDLQFAEGDTIAILSENSLEHALLALAALHVGIPYSPISPAYALTSGDFSKLRHTLTLLAPKLIFAQNGREYAPALAMARGLFPTARLVSVEEPVAVSFNDLLATTPTTAVAKAHERVTGDTVAKILFTSGSTGLPKGVINTHRMWCANLQQITQAFPCLAAKPPVFIDWLPWNHTFGGNHNVGMALYNGGTLYIDDGKPTPDGIETTVQNLRELSPTAYFNVPKGFSMLLPYLEAEPDLRATFFRNLHFLFYAGASLAQPVWSRLEALSRETTGRVVPIITGLGCTESGPSALFANWPGSYSGLLGVPVAGLSVKLVPDGNKLEIRYKGPNVTPGYWQQTAATASAFDEEGYYKTGDAVRFVDETDPDKGLLFDGRIAEDFKLSTGTWVNVGILKASVLAAGSPVVQDVVLAGLDQEYVSAILFLNPQACQQLADLPANTPQRVVFQHPAVQQFVDALLARLNQTATGSANRIARAIVALDPPSIDLGEITDKGSLNQRAVLQHRAVLVQQLYTK